MSSSKDTAITIRLAPPVLWGDNATKDTIWTIINNGIPASYSIHVNSYDTNGTNFKPIRYYWQDASAAFDSTNTNTAIDKAATDKDTANWPFRSGETNKGKALWIYARDNDQLVRGGKFIVYADSAPPAPIISHNAASSPITIYWSGKDAKDSMQTEYKVLLKDGADPNENADTVTNFRAGTTFSNATTDGYDFKITAPLTSNTPKHIYHYEVIARDKRSTISRSVIQTFSF